MSLNKSKTWAPGKRADASLNNAAPASIIEVKDVPKAPNLAMRNSPFPRTPVRLQFRNLSVQINSTQRSCGSNGCYSDTSSRTILDNLSGTFEPGDFIAIMGASGAGKTTFLDALAHRITDSSTKVTGEILINDSQATTDLMSAVSGYASQSDVLLGTLTPRETMEFACRMKVGAVLDDQQVHEQVNKTLSALDLMRCADQRIGSLLLRGISGGEKRRTVLGVEMVTEPPLFFADEPTSGLDSATAVKITNVLRGMTGTGRIVMCTIHQPSSQIFSMFDKLLLLSNGRMCYFGDAADAVTFFSNQGFMCPLAVNPAEFFMATLMKSDAGDIRQPERVNRLALANSASLVNGRRPSKKQKATSEAAPVTMLEAVVDYMRPDYKTQLWRLLVRAFVHFAREPVNTVARVIENVFLSFFVGALYFDMGKNQQSVGLRVAVLFFMVVMAGFLSVMNAVIAFADERLVFLKESAGQMYFTSAYFIAKASVSMIVEAILAVPFCVLGYFMTGLLNADAGAVWAKFLLAMITMGSAAHAVGLLLGALVPITVMAVMLSPLSMVPFMLVSGFFLNLDSVPNYLTWLKSMSPHRYAFTALMVNEFKTLKFHCSSGEYIDAGGGFKICPFVNGTQILDKYSVKDTEYWYDIGLIVLLTSCYLLAAYWVLKLSTMHRDTIKAAIASPLTACGCRQPGSFWYSVTSCCRNRDEGWGKQMNSVNHGQDSVLAAESTSAAAARSSALQSPVTSNVGGQSSNSPLLAKN